MSSPRRLIIAADARSDIRGILLHTVQQWGTTQRARYKAEIDATFALLHEHPYIGTSRDGLRPGIRARPIGPSGQRIVYYRVESAAIRILRVMHVKIWMRRANLSMSSSVNDHPDTRERIVNGSSSVG